MGESLHAGHSGTALIGSFELATRRLDQALGSAVSGFVVEPGGDRQVGDQVDRSCHGPSAELPRASASRAARRASVA